MNLTLPQAFSGAIAVVALFGIVVLSPAQAAEMVQMRGTIVSLEGPTLTVKTREGPNAIVMLKPGWKMAGVAKASVEDNKPGDVRRHRRRSPQRRRGRSVEVLVFPPSDERDPARALILWTRKPPCLMTNATVTNAPIRLYWRTLDLPGSGGKEKKILILLDGVPIVTPGPMTEADLKPARRYLPAQKELMMAHSSELRRRGMNGVDPSM